MDLVINRDGSATDGINSGGAATVVTRDPATHSDLKQQDAIKTALNWPLTLIILAPATVRHYSEQLTTAQKV